jgi:hypothetical protein
LASLCKNSYYLPFLFLKKKKNELEESAGESGSERGNSEGREGREGEEGRLTRGWKVNAGRGARSVIYS